MRNPAPLTKIPTFPAPIAFVVVLPNGAVNAGVHAGVEREFASFPLFLEWAAKRLAVEAKG
jgi:hypothetical protein